jgi:outer membrane protein OmpA-like peptidoglycan-associated protein
LWFFQISNRVADNWLWFVGETAMRKWLPLVLGLGLVCAAADAVAQAPPPPAATGIIWTGPYVGLFGGAAFGGRVNATSPSSTANPPVFYNSPEANAANGGRFNYNLGKGPLAGGTLGYNWQFPGMPIVLGAELEGGFIYLRKSVTDPFSLGVNHGGDSTSAARIGNWYGVAAARAGYAFDAFLPYVKGGVGVTRVNATFSDNCTTPPCGSGTLNTSATRTKAFGVGGAGLEWALAPAFSLKAEYLYMAVGSTLTGCGAGGGTATGTTFCSTNRISDGVHTAKLGLNFRFAVPAAVVAPPPPPPPPPPPARQVFLVFFDWDKDTITRDGRAIIQAAANAWRAGANVTIQVTGYTDASGSPGYNQRLSERRANNVANALGAAGVPRAAMVVSGRGMNDQRVPTAPGVREPQNRRVEIVFP